MSMKKLTAKEKVMTAIRCVITIIVISLIVFLTIKFLPMMENLSDETYRLQFKNKVSDMGLSGVLLILVLQVLQIVVAVIPGQPMEIVTGMLYGTLGGVLLCLIGIFIGTTSVYFIVRKIGTGIMQLFFSPEKISDIQNSRIFKNSKKFELLLFIIFIIPMIPKDIFIYLGGISPIKPKRFLFIATIARIPSLFLTVYAGNRLSEGNIALTVVFIAVFMIIGCIGYFISSRAQEKLEKDCKE